MTQDNELLLNVKAALDKSEVLPFKDRQTLLELKDPFVSLKLGKQFTQHYAGTSVEVDLSFLVLSNATVSNFQYHLTTKLAALNVVPNITLAPYGAFDQILSVGDPLLDNHFDYAILFIDESYFIPENWSPIAIDELTQFMQGQYQALEQSINALLTKYSFSVILHTLPVDNSISNQILSQTARSKFLSHWHRMNADMLLFSEKTPGVMLIDYVSLLTNSNIMRRDERLFQYAHYAFSEEAFLLLSGEVRRFVQARKGLSKKVLALDLDNTLWGGVVGEVGYSGIELGGLYPGKCYQALQSIVKRLRDQGVVLVLLSKNDHNYIATLFERHSEIMLSLGDFSITKINWEPKSQNLKAVLSALSLHQNSVVFMDDSIHELSDVSANLPEVTLIQVPDEPADLVKALLESAWFDSTTITELDKKRPDLYVQRVGRIDFSKQFERTEDYLHELHMQLSPSEVDEFSAARVSQLSLRTNQFNLTGLRYNLSDIMPMIESPFYRVWTFSLKDKFSKEGIVGAAWVSCEGEVWRILNFVLSCRALGRGVESAAVTYIIDVAKKACVKALQASYVPTDRNDLAKDFWCDCGFVLNEQRNSFDLLLEHSKDIKPPWIHIVDEKELVCEQNR